MGDFVPYPGGGLVGVVRHRGRRGASTSIRPGRHDHHGGRGLRRFGLVTTPDRSIVGYSSTTVALLVSIEDGGRPQSCTLGPSPARRTPPRCSGSGTCQEEYPEGGGCTAFLERRGTAGELHDLARHRRRPAWVSSQATDGRATAFRVIGLDRGRAAPVGGLLDPRGDGWRGRPATTCRTSFSPRRSRRSWATESVAKTGDLGGLARFGRRRAAGSGPTWSWDESPTHRITDVHVGGRRPPARRRLRGRAPGRSHALGIDGPRSVEGAAAPVRALRRLPPYLPPGQLSTRQMVSRASAAGASPAERRPGRPASPGARRRA